MPSTYWAGDLSIQNGMRYSIEQREVYARLNIHGARLYSPDVLQELLSPLV